MKETSSSCNELERLPSTTILSINSMKKISLSLNKPEIPLFLTGKAAKDAEKTQSQVEKLFNAFSNAADNLSVFLNVPSKHVNAGVLLSVSNLLEIYNVAKSQFNQFVKESGCDYSVSLADGHAWPIVNAYCSPHEAYKLATREYLSKLKGLGVSLPDTLIEDKRFWLQLEAYGA